MFVSMKHRKIPVELFLARREILVQLFFNWLFCEIFMISAQKWLKHEFLLGCRLLHLGQNYSLSFAHWPLELLSLIHLLLIGLNFLIFVLFETLRTLWFLSNFQVLILRNLLAWFFVFLDDSLDFIWRNLAIFVSIIDEGRVFRESHMDWVVLII